MCKKMFLLISVLLVGLANAATVWNPAANGIVPPATGDWNDVANWTNGLPDNPDTNKAVFNVPDAAECIVSAAQTANQWVQGDGADGGVVRVISGGSLSQTQAKWSAVGYNAPAHMIVEAGGLVEFGQHMWIGLNDDSVGTLDINGGVVTVAEMLGLGWNGGTATGYVNVNDGGLLALSNIHGDGASSIKGASLLSINGTGAVTLPGDFVDVIDAYAAAGLIAGNGVLGAVQAVVADEVTTVTAVAPPINVATVTELEAAAAAAVAGDRIVLAEGTYAITSQIEIKDGVTYQGAGAGLTIIDGNDATRAFVAWGDRSATNGQVQINDANEVVGVPNTTGQKDWVLDGLTIQNCVSDANNRSDILSSARDLLNNYPDAPYTLASAQEENGATSAEWFDILSGGADDDLTDVELQAYLDGNPVGSAGHIIANGDKDDDGGAVILKNGAAGTIRNCEFSNNAAVNDAGSIAVEGPGGGATIQNCAFSNNLADDDGGAIAVDSEGLAVSIENCAFNSCSALADDGGAIYLSGNASTYIVMDTNFTDCTAINDGGAVKADGSDSSITFSNCTFSNISADDDGGAIALSAGGQAVSIENCAFNSCSNNGDDGGAVYMSSQGSTYTFTDTTFTGCISNDDAGVAYCSGSNSTYAFSNCTLHQNTCVDEGGAVKVASPGSTVTFTDTIFTENYAGDDAGAAHITGDDANYVLTGCSFIGNTCNDDWAALRYNPDRAELTMTNCSFISNGLDADGAVVGDDSVLGFDDDDAGPSTISNCLIAYNACNDDWVMELKAAFSLLNCTFIGNASADGSKSMIGVRGQPWDSTGDEVDDVVTDVSIISNCLFINNTTIGPVIGDTYDDVFAPTVTNCLFYGNLAANTDDNSPEVGTIDVSAVTDAAQIVVDPAGDYHLVAGSPAIDASDPATATDADIEGTAAVGVRDVGAYESVD